VVQALVHTHMNDDTSTNNDSSITNELEFISPKHKNRKKKKSKSHKTDKEKESEKKSQKSIKRNAVHHHLKIVPVFMKLSSIKMIK